MNNESSPPVSHNPALRRFELRTDGALAVLEYSSTEEGVSFDHTYVPDALRGKGVGAILVRAALREAEQQGWRVIPRCTFVAAYLRKHPAGNG